MQKWDGLYRAVSNDDKQQKPQLKLGFLDGFKISHLRTGYRHQNPLVVHYLVLELLLVVVGEIAHHH